MTVPVSEAVETAETIDEIGTRFQHQVIGVAQDDFGAEFLKISRCECAHCSSSADWHETRRTKRTPSGVHNSSTSVSVSCVDLQSKDGFSCVGAQHCSNGVEKNIRIWAPCHHN